MVAQIDEALKKAVTILTAAGAREVYLFGSVVHGTERDDSDLDLAVTGLPPAVFFKTLAELGDALERHVDVVDLDEASPFTRCLRSEGELRRVG